MKQSAFIALPLAATAVAMAISKPQLAGTHPIAKVTSSDQAVADVLPAMLHAYKAVRQAIAETPSKQDDEALKTLEKEIGELIVVDAREEGVAQAGAQITKRGQVLSTLTHYYPKLQPSTLATIAAEDEAHISERGEVLSTLTHSYPKLLPSTLATITSKLPVHHPSRTIHPDPSTAYSVDRSLYSPCFGPIGSWSSKVPVFVRNLFPPGCKSHNLSQRPGSHHNKTTAYEHATSTSKNGGYGNASLTSKTGTYEHATLTSQTGAYGHAIPVHKTTPYGHAISTSKATAYESTTSPRQTKSHSIIGSANIVARTANGTFSHYTNATVTTHRSPLYTGPPKLFPHHTYRPGRPPLPPLKPIATYVPPPQALTMLVHQIEKTVHQRLSNTTDETEKERLRTLQQQLETIKEIVLVGMPRGIHCPDIQTTEQLALCQGIKQISKNAVTATEEDPEHIRDEREVPSEAAELMLTPAQEQRRREAVRLLMDLAFAHNIRPAWNSTLLGPNDEPRAWRHNSTEPFFDRCGLGMTPEKIRAYFARYEEAQNKPVENTEDDVPAEKQMHERDVKGAVEPLPWTAGFKVAHQTFHMAEDALEGKPRHKFGSEHVESKPQDGSVDDDKKKGAMGFKASPVRPAMHTVTVTVPPS